MPTDVIMPQMGESIFEGTLTKWLKKPGDKVSRDEPLFEISTDKVDAEIPSPAAGVLVEQKVAEGTTVQVNTVVGVIGEEGPAAAPAPKAAAPAPAATQSAPQPVPTTEGKPTGQASKPSAGGESEIDTVRGAQQMEQRGGSQAVPAQQQNVAQVPQGGNEARGIRSSPLVRKIAKDKNIDLNNLAGSGSGSGGRITKDDILGFVEKHGAGASAPAQQRRAPQQQQQQYAPQQSSAQASAPYTPPPAGQYALSGDV